MLCTEKKKLVPSLSTIVSLSVLNNFELCYRGTSFKVQGGSVIAAVFLAHNYVSEQFGNYVEYGIYRVYVDSHSLGQLALASKRIS